MTKQQKTLNVLTKRGHNPAEAARMVEENFEVAIKCYPTATPAKLADFIIYTA